MLPTKTAGGATVLAVWLGLLLVVGVLRVAETAVAEDPVFSGPQPGEKLKPFLINSAAGKEADRKLDIVTDAKDQPCVLVFVHERSRPSLGLTNQIMRLVEKRGMEKIVGGVVFLTDDPTETNNWLSRVPDYFPKQIRMGISVDGLEGPGAYGLNRKVSLTVLVAKDRVVQANFALVQPSIEVDGPKIFKAIAEALGESEVPNITDEVAMRRDPKASNAPNRSEPNPEIRSLLRPLIQLTATDEAVLSAAKKIEDFAAKNPDARIEIGNIARRIIDAGKLNDYGTPKCREFLTKWGKDFIPDAKPDAKAVDKPSK